jgi:hypothetical protein
VASRLGESHQSLRRGSSYRADACGSLGCGVPRGLEHEPKTQHAPPIIFPKLAPPAEAAVRKVEAFHGMISVLGMVPGYPRPQTAKAGNAEIHRLTTRQDIIRFLVM